MLKKLSPERGVLEEVGTVTLILLAPPISFLLFTSASGGDIYNHIRYLYYSYANIEDGDALRSALASGNYEAAELLLKREADINSINDVLPDSVYFCSLNLKKVKFLIKNNIELSIKNQFGDAILHTAVRSYTEYWKYASEHHCKSRDYFAMINFLKKNGAEINAVNNEGKTPLHLAVESGCDAGDYGAFGVELLLSLGAEPTIKDANGKLPIDYASDNCIRIIDMLYTDVAGVTESLPTADL